MPTKSTSWLTSLAPQALDDSTWAIFGSDARLSPRELAIVRAIVEYDSSMSEIARDLGIAVDTVRTYFKRTYAKLDVNSRAAAVSVVLRWQVTRTSNSLSHL
ncbi:response regulator transcription factor [Planctomycetota bacterium]